ncbi:fibropellin-1-like isoform X2 [Anneissia japonica]|uniref:fibropellin-1-like isoform X2 n=1 Tax=Anneissia japonica TaxID=1529436 RepID=UPI0014259A69|nr:fibropellin-1-like isoform X2 [Anneissia japonica]
MKLFIVLVINHVLILQTEAVGECFSFPCQNGANCVEAAEAYICYCQYGWMGTNCDITSGQNCGTNHYAATGQISSPNYPADYADRSACIYLIRVSKAQKIVFTIEQFNTEKDRDFYEYGAGGTADFNVAIAQYSGNTSIPSEAPFTLPFTYTITDDSAWILFSADFNNPRSGWTLSYRADLDDCLSAPCLNGAICTDAEFSYSCQCAPGYEGDNCETNINECSSSPCQNGAGCVDGLAMYSCTCTPGWTGINCNIDINECSSSPCLNGATCNNLQNMFTCSCLAGYTGTLCETNIDECQSQPCQNNGACTDNINQYTCSCVGGWTGDVCNVDYDECSSTPCQNGAQCANGVNRYDCTCVPGYNGINCENNINECLSNPCQNLAVCIDNVNRYECDCTASWTGANCEIDTNECASNPCQNGGACVDGTNRFDCTCVQGWSGTLCEQGYNECFSFPCQNGGVCTDAINGSFCTCQPGYSGARCDEDVDECASNPCVYTSFCVDGTNGYSCTCLSGYEGERCEEEHYASTYLILVYIVFVCVVMCTLFVFICRWYYKNHKKTEHTTNMNNIQTSSAPNPPREMSVVASSVCSAIPTATNTPDNTRSAVSASEEGQH